MPDPVLPGLADERRFLDRARAAVEARLERLTDRTGSGADGLADEWIAAVLAGTVEQLRKDLVVFGRIDDEIPWRVGLYGVDEGGDQLVVDWRAPFAEAFYRASFDDPMGLTRRVSYVGAIDDLFVEEFATGEVRGTAPLLAELSRERGATMRAAVATLQQEQDRLVRLDPRARLVLRGGPGTGKTVVGLHRAAWLVYNDRRVTADRILVLGPSERYLRFVATVLPTLGEARIRQTTFETLLGPATGPGADERWPAILDRLERSLLRPDDVRVGRRLVLAEEVAELVDRCWRSPLPWRDRRRSFVAAIGRRAEGVEAADVAAAVRAVWPAVPTRQAWAKVRNRRVLEGIGVEPDLIRDWLAVDDDGPLLDEVRARFEGTPARYSHVIVDEAQDLSLLQLRAVLRRGEGFTLVGDDAQRSNPAGIGLPRAAALLDAPVEELRTAYRMSAEIADWLNDHARRHRLDAVELLGIRPTGVAVRVVPGADTAAEADRLAVR
ncbi:MAG: AAA family ATPase [Acidimicrobiia bacterium]